MNKLVLVVICLGILLSACIDDKKRSLTESAIHAKVDSIVGAKMDEVSRQSMEDLDKRMTIEVKAKADSIVAARTGKRDTMKKTQQAESKQIMPPNFFHNKK